MQKTVQRSDKINSQKPSENAKNCPLFFRVTLPPTIGLCDVGEFEKRPPGTEAQLKNDYDDNKKSQIETRLPEQMPYRITKAHCYSVRPNIAKPLVGGRCSSRSYNFSCGVCLSFIYSSILY